MGTDSAILLANVYHFSNELDFLDHLIESISCPVFIYKPSFERRFLDDLFVPDMPDLSNVKYVDKKLYWW